MNYGGFWIRFLAYVVDSLIVFIAFFAIVMLVTVMGLELISNQLILFVMGVLYYALMQSSKRQATFGKALLGLKVGGPDGERIGIGRALAREVAKILSTLTLLIGFIIAAFTRRKQALHDLIATTVVVRSEPGHVVAGLAIALLALVAPFIAVFMFGAAMFTAMLGDFAGSMLPGTDIAMRQQTQKPAAPAPGAKPAAPAPGTAAPTAKPAAPAAPATGAHQPATSTAAAPTTASGPATAATPAAKPAAPAATAPAVVAQAPQAAKPASAPPEPPKPMAAEPAKPKPMAEEPAKPKVAEPAMEKAPEPARKPEVAEAPKPAAAPMRTAAPAAQMQTVPGPKFNDLATAILYRDPQTVEELLRYGKWPDKPDSRGVTPLMLAASLGDARSVEALLKAGANPNRPGPAGETAVIIARERKDTAMLGLMQRYGGR